MRWMMIGLLTAALSASGPAWAATPPTRTAPPRNPKPVVTNPDWAALPSPDDIARYYPEHAMRNGISGRAVIGCLVSAEGLLTNCEVISESPPGEDFGAAAVRMAPAFRMKPKTLDGTPVEGAEVRIPILFQAPPPGSEGEGPPMGPPPGLPPTTGRFLLLGTERLGGSSGGGPPFIGYLRTSDSAPVDGKVSTWMLLVFQPSEGRTMYWITQQAFDCAGQLMKLDSLQMFTDTDQRMGWSTNMESDWHAADSPILAKALDLACGKTQPDTPALASVAAARADAASRFVN